MTTSSIRNSPSGEIVEVQGGGGEPLHRTLYVDPDTSTPTADQNGFIGLPYATLEAAGDAIEADEFTILISGNGDLEVGPLVTSFSMCLRGIPGLANASASIQAVTTTADLGIEDLTCGDVITSTGGASLRFNNCHVTSGVVSDSDVTIRNCPTVGDLECTTLNVRDCDLVSGTINAATANFSNCTLEGLITCTGDMTIKYCSMNNDATIVNADTNLTIQFCQLENEFTFNVGGDLNIDTVTYQTALNNGIIFNVTGAINFTDPPLSGTALVAVPALAAGELDYVDVSVIGTNLEDRLAVGDPLIVNPNSDIEPAGPGGGLLYARVSAANTVRLAFIGATTGGNVVFTITRAR